MKKQIMVLFLTICMIFGLSINVFAEDAAVSWLCNENDDGTITITGYTGELVGDIVFPSEIDGKKVSSIGEKVFRNCDTITGITIPPGVTSIGASAFSLCDNLRHVEIPGTVTNIGRFAFYGTAIVNVDLPEGLISIGDSAFYQCFSMASVTIPSTVTTIGNGAFEFSTALEAFTVSEHNQNYKSADGVLYSKDMTVLLKCPSMKRFSFEIPNTVSIIADRAFEYSRLTSISVPNSVTRIGEYAFYDADLTSVIIPGNVKVLGQSAFELCSLMSSATIKKGVEEIGAAAFSQCMSLRNIVLPTGVTTIGNMTFYRCSQMKNITIPKSVTSIGSNTFYGCNDLSDVYYGGSRTEWNRVEIGSYNTSLEKAEKHYSTINYKYTGNADGIITITGVEGKLFGDIVLPSEIGGKIVTGIADNTFQGQTKLVSVVISEGIRFIHEDVFRNCAELADIYYEGTKEQWFEISIAEGAIPEGVAIHFSKVSEIIIGDVNSDNFIDCADVNLLYRVIMDHATLTDEQVTVADVNRDGDINSGDVNLLYRFVMGYAALSE